MSTAGDGNSGDGDLDKRLKALSERIEASKSREDAKNPVKADNDKAGMAQAFRLSSEFIAAIGVGALIGYGIDRYFEIAPWAMILFLMLGFAAGILNVLRSLGQVAPSAFDSRVPRNKAQPPRAEEEGRDKTR